MFGRNSRKLGHKLLKSSTDWLKIAQGWKKNISQGYVLYTDEFRQHFVGMTIAIYQTVLPHSMYVDPFIQRNSQGCQVAITHWKLCLVHRLVGVRALSSQPLLGGQELLPALITHRTNTPMKGSHSACQLIHSAPFDQDEKDTFTFRQKGKNGMNLILSWNGLTYVVDCSAL